MPVTATLQPDVAQPSQPGPPPDASKATTVPRSARGGWGDAGAKRMSPSGSAAYRTARILGKAPVVTATRPMPTGGRRASASSAPSSVTSTAKSVAVLIGGVSASPDALFPGQRSLFV